MVVDDKISPLIALALSEIKNLAARPTDRKPFCFLPAMWVQTRCCCAIVAEYTLVSISDKQDNLFLKQHINYCDSINLIIEKLRDAQDNSGVQTCEFCQFMAKMNRADKHTLNAIVCLDTYADASQYLGLSQKSIYSRLYSILERINVRDKRLFFRWYKYMLIHSTTFRPRGLNIVLSAADFPPGSEMNEMINGH
ncbi:hypothetical protein [Citrobacter amalonaticus]|uniref:hypothetical protein n=1 Tax=Citrobacter amalonaticus TaxID=35703 RepID=UPI00255AB830|nr:hypothetical protein [Citrobacter amalonaticus]MDL4617995.1 hypothetical protein [Citrobacter amalonaticus]MDL4622093.1 hypothetical protein [Citrobacter amalonaticus]